MRPSNGYPDPQWIGNHLLRVAETYRITNPRMTFAEVADYSRGTIEDHAPLYPQDETLGQLATRVYQSELRVRAEQGDKFAKATLEEGGWNEPS